MPQIKLEKLKIENFKGIKDLCVQFSDVTNISGRNATGKTTICDAFFWLLFDKDSQGNTKFNIRPLDKDGKQIDNIEINVTCVLSVDGQEIELSKTQKQKWVKKRGTDVATLQGNENVYEIDGFPATEREFQEKISSIIDEYLFKLVTNPNTFASLKWQEQRKVLMEFVSDITDADVLNADPDAYLPIADDVRAAGIDKALEQAKNTLKKLKEKQKEYPARIDEASRAIVDVGDTSALETKKQTVEQMLKETRQELDGISESFREASDLQVLIMQKRFEIGNIEMRAKRKVIQALSDARNAHEEANKRSNDLFFQRKSEETSLQTNENRLAGLEEQMKGIKARYLSIKQETMPEGSFTCPVCGQDLPEDQAIEVQSRYDEGKAKRLADVIAEGDRINALVIECRNKISEGRQKIERLADEWTVAAQTEGKAYEYLSNLPQEPDMGADVEYKQAQGELKELEQKLAGMDSGDKIKSAIREREAELQNELSEVNRMLSAVDANARAEERVAELREEQLEVSQQTADQEQKVFLLEALSKAKMEMLSERINEQFEIVNFKLFENLINGGYKDTCEMTMYGVPYSSLNSAGKIQGGLDVIKALSRLYGVSAPIIIDNRESTIDIPDMDAQIINLYVDERFETLDIQRG